MLRQLHWICTQPTPYNDYLFRALAADPDIDLTVHFQNPILDSHPWISTMAGGFTSRVYRRVLGFDWHLLRKVARDDGSFFVVAGWRERTIVAVVTLLGLRQRAFAIWTDTPRSSANRPDIVRLLRGVWLKQVFNNAAFVMGTGIPALGALRNMGCPGEKLVNFPFVVDLALLSPGCPRPDANDNQVVLLSSGVLMNWHKGYDIALRALGKLKQQTDVPFVYRIAGVGPDRLMLERLAEEVGIKENVQFLDWLEPCQLPNFYRSGDIFLHPSHFDPYPVAVLEAMACGLPVIGSDQAGSVVDRIEHMKNGFIHRDSDVEDLAEKLSYAFQHREELTSIGKAARARAEQWPASRATGTIKDLMRQVR